MDSLEKHIGNLNAFVFFREFSFSQNKFTPCVGSEVEFADQVVWIDDMLFIYQLKERNAPEDTNSEQEERWFKNKVVKAATKQIRDTLTYLDTHAEIHLTNERGHTFNILTNREKTISKIVLYSANKYLPSKCRNKKYHKSSSAGFIHILSLDDYILMCETLVTPAEIQHYMLYREKLIEKWDYETVELLESAILGHYIYGKLDLKPCIDSRKYLLSLIDDRIEWDFTNIARIFADRITYGDREPDDYYPIITEIAKLNRTALKLFKERFELAKDNANRGEIVKPYRFYIPETNCGFVFVAVGPDILSEHTSALVFYTEAHKYDMEALKCIGVSILPDTERQGGFYAEWCFIEFPWKHDERIENALKEKSPFLKVREAYFPTYRLES